MTLGCSANIDDAYHITLWLKFRVCCIDAGVWIVALRNVAVVLHEPQHFQTKKDAHSQLLSFVLTLWFGIFNQKVDSKS